MKYAYCDSKPPKAGEVSKKTMENKDLRAGVEHLQKHYAETRHEMAKPMKKDR